VSARSHEHQRLTASSLCTRRDPIILEGFFELVLNIVRVVGELHERGVIAGAAATSEARIILRRPRIVGELHEHLVIAGAAATSQVRIVLARIVSELLVIADAAATGQVRIVLPRIVGELLIIADAAATGQARIVLPWIVGVGGDNAAERLTFGYVELVTRTYDDCPGAKLAGAQIFDLNSGAAFSLSRYDLKRFCVDIDAVIFGYCQDGLCVSGCKRGDADGGAHDYRCCTLPHGTELLCGGTLSTISLTRRGRILSLAARE